MRHFVTAVANADPPVGGRADDLACPFVVEDMKGVLGGKCQLVDEDAPQLCLSIGEEGLDEVFFNVHVFVEKFA